jgi:tRNA(fMet)-specific endonuclease VapC
VIDAETAVQYAVVYQELRRRGLPIPTNDMWIAASALQHGFAVFSDDGHFHEVPRLHVGTRLDDFLVERGDPSRCSWRRKHQEIGAFGFFD